MKNEISLMTDGDWCELTRCRNQTVVWLMYLSIFGIADRVGLSVLDSNGGHSEVTHSFLRQLMDTNTMEKTNILDMIEATKNNCIRRAGEHNTRWPWCLLSPWKQRCWRIPYRFCLRFFFVWDRVQTALWPPSHRAHSLDPSEGNIPHYIDLTSPNYTSVAADPLPGARSSCHFSFWRGSSEPPHHNPEQWFHLTPEEFNDWRPNQRQSHSRGRVVMDLPLLIWSWQWERHTHQTQQWNRQKTTFCPTLYLEERLEISRIYRWHRIGHWWRPVLTSCAGIGGCQWAENLHHVVHHAHFGLVLSQRDSNCSSCSEKGKGQHFLSTLRLSMQDFHLKIPPLLKLQL